MEWSLLCVFLALVYVLGVNRVSLRAMTYLSWDSPAILSDAYNVGRICEQLKYVVPQGSKSSSQLVVSTNKCPSYGLLYLSLWLCFLFCRLLFPSSFFHFHLDVYWHQWTKIFIFPLKYAQPYELSFHSSIFLDPQIWPLTYPEKFSSWRALPPILESPFLLELQAEDLPENFSGGPVVKTPRFQCRGHRLDLWLGN